LRAVEIINSSMEVTGLSALNTLSPWQPGILSLVVYLGLVFLLTGCLLFLCARLGEKRPAPQKKRPYESGIIPTGSARLEYPVPFYLVAIFFLIFDLEGAFIFTWAIAADDLGWSGWMQISFFIIVLLLSLLYIWRKGGLEWGPFSAKR
jgi:NADH-quinone oxidoreductase subunit A